MRSELVIPAAKRPYSQQQGEVACLKVRDKPFDLIAADEGAAEHGEGEVEGDAALVAHGRPAGSARRLSTARKSRRGERWATFYEAKEPRLNGPGAVTTPRHWVSELLVRPCSCVGDGGAR